MHVLGDGVLGRGDLVCFCSFAAAPELDVVDSSERGDARKIGTGQSNLGKKVNYLYKYKNNLNLSHVLGYDVLGRADFFRCCAEPTARARFVRREAASAAEWSWVAVST